MSTNNSNNSGSGNVSGGSVYIGAGGGGGGGGGTAAGTWQTFTISVPWVGGIFGIPPAEPTKEEKKKDRDGCDCKKCKEFYPYSEPNQEDGTLICYACRHGY
jgi:hypothetical protein